MDQALSIVLKVKPAKSKPDEMKCRGENRDEKIINRYYK
jgi:hypothetical protein